MTSATAEPVTQHYTVAPDVGLMADHWGELSDNVVMFPGFLEEFPTAHFVDVTDAGHMVAGDKNDVFTAAVVEFIDSLHV